MNGNLSLRQAQIVEAVNGLRKLQPVCAVRVYVVPAPGAELRGMRGFVRHGQPPPCFEPCPESSAPLSSDDLDRLKSACMVDELRVGDYLHILVESDRSGYLHMFNLGMSGRVAKLFPHSPESTRWIPAQRTLLVTPNEGMSPFVEAAEPYQEKGDSYGDNGRANGYPERLLAVVTDRQVAVEAGDFHVDWLGFNAHYRGLDSEWDRGAVTDSLTGRFETKHGREGWGWGLFEIPVVDRVNL
ncbi:MAG TPA: DUF4384 domain-containing protein [Candidatus Paceibacterota bacterium]|nr:DUF4384 domain-containing protein [Verrucomicrobiota bacterium]HRZ47495.1 DUF4384 domain-containing protein [Candidatus Paceibacterota bacterium]HSA01906.1 DUF4384 domain-containing protein [Candidatus Paceibacterota bacterium]